MIGVKPYIGFNGKCEEALNFYKTNLNAEIQGLLKYGDTPNAPEGSEDKVMHAVLKVGDTVIMAADDCTSDGQAVVGDNISLALGLDSVEDAESMFAQMAEGGTIKMPLQETFWASRFGMLKDKYGINWMFNCEKPHGSRE